MTNHILQWNCRSVNANFEELNIFINENKQVAICLQETFLKDSDKLTLNITLVSFKTVVIMIKF